MKDLRFGIEIETIAPSHEAIVYAIHRVVGGAAQYGQVTMADGRIWKVVRDSSLLPSRGGVGAEVVSPILTYADIEPLQEIVRAVRRAGAYVNESCGIHVHVDASTLEPRHIVNLVKIVHKQEPLIEAALGIHAGRQRYCRSIDPEFMQTLNRRRAWTLEALNRAWYGYHNPNPHHYDQTRYRAINLHAIWNHGTVEYRWANGTLHAGQVKAYVQFALAITAKAKSQRSAQSAKRTYDPASAKYDMRVFLLGLGMIGPEFKTARDHLLSRMPGNAAWKHGRPTRTRAAQADEA